MEITLRSLWTLIHGMGFGALYLLACSGALVELWHLTAPSPASPSKPGQERFLKIYLVAMVILAWSAVLTGAYVIYPWYRAAPPPGTVDLSLFPQRLLLSNPATMGWHSLGMEWKEHVAWFAPISITMAHMSSFATAAISPITNNCAPRCWALPQPRFWQLASPASSEP